MKKATHMSANALSLHGWSAGPRGLGARAMALVLIALAALSFVSSPVAAQQLETFDPDEAFAEETSEGAASPASTGAIDADLVEPASPTARPLPTTQPLPVAGPLPGQEATPEPSAMGEEFAIYSEPPVEGATPSAETAGAVSETAGQPARTAMAEEETFAEDDLIGAAEGVFGKGAEGLAKMIEGLLKKEGRPNGYIVGREAGGAFVVGARYGSGTLHHKVEGERKVYWTGPSVGFDAGANAGNTFVLVYNLWDSEDLFKRYPAGEGQAYFVGGLHASYVRRGDVVLIPIRMGAGVRLGVNAGYMRFSKKQRWLPF